MTLQNSPLKVNLKSDGVNLDMVARDPGFKLHHHVKRRIDACFLRNLGAGGAHSSQILRALTKFYGPSMIPFRT